MIATLLSRQRLLLATSAVLYLLVLGALLASGQTTIGISRFFYLAIVLAALATGPVIGAAAGVLASALYALAVVVHDAGPWQILTGDENAFRCSTFIALGALVGAIARSNRELVSRLRLLAECDSLTGLGNVRAFEDALRRQFLRGKSFGLLVGDMDYLKQINDERGHAAGDDALRGLAGSLAHAIGPRDAAFRIGGDEFAVLTELDGGSTAAELAARVAADLATAGHSISFGWAIAPREGSTPLSLYRAADDRMYERKRLARRREAQGSIVELLSPRRERTR